MQPGLDLCETVVDGAQSALQWRANMLKRKTGTNEWAIPRGLYRGIIALVCSIITCTPVKADNTTGSRFHCIVSSDQQKAMMLVFDSAEKLLYWGDNEPEKMTITTAKDNPFEISAERQRKDLPTVALRIWSEGGVLRFFANAGDSLFTGTCERH